MRDTDAELAREAQQGDAAAFESLVRTHQRMVHSLAYRMTGSLADADDLAQEAFIRAHEQLGAYRGEASFSTWLYKIALNTCLNWRQKEARRNEVYAAWAESTEALGERSERSGLGEQALAALLKLPAKQRAAVILTICDGWDHREAAKALGCSTATVAWRVFAAKQTLKKALERGRK